MVKKLFYFALVIGVFAAGAFIKTWSEDSTAKPAWPLKKENPQATKAPKADEAQETSRNLAITRTIKDVIG